MIQAEQSSAGTSLELVVRDPFSVATPRLCSETSTSLQQHKNNSIPATLPAPSAFRLARTRGIVIVARHTFTNVWCKIRGMAGEGEGEKAELRRDWGTEGRLQNWQGRGTGNSNGGWDQLLA